MSKHVFISYVREDINAVLKLSAILRKWGFEVWFDEAISKGEDWQETIEQAIDDSFAFIAVFSRNTAKRDRLGTMPEIDRAIAIQRQLPAGKRYILPLALGSVKVPSIRINQTTNINSLQVTRIVGQRDSQQKELDELRKSLHQIEGTSLQSAPSNIFDPFPTGTDTLKVVLKDSIADFLVAVSSVWGTVSGRRRAILSCAIVTACWMLSTMFQGFYHQETTGLSRTSFPAIVPWIFGVAGIVLTWIPKQKDNLPPGAGPTTAPEPTRDSAISEKTAEYIARLRSHIRTFQQREIAFRREIQIVRDTDNLANRQISRLTTWSAIWCGACYWIASFPAQGLVQKLNYQEFNEPARGVIFFSGSAIAVIGFAVVGNVLASRARRGSNISRIRASVLVGSGGFLAGLIWLLQLSPEMTNILGDRTNYETAAREYFDDWGVSWLGFLAAHKILAVPLAGSVGAFFTKGR